MDESVSLVATIPPPSLLSSAALRLACRAGEFSGQTSSRSPGHVQANLCILPKESAFDFLLFCQRNPKPCPLLAVLEEGEYLVRADILKPSSSGDGIGPNMIDIRTDLPKYRVFVDGVLSKEVCDVSEYWRRDLVTFIIGCSFSFEEALLRSGLKIRHMESGPEKTVPMYKTNIPCTPAGRFHGDMVVSMRPFVPSDAVRAVEITSRYPRVHGSPVWVGSPEQLGINNLSEPDFGDAVEMKQGEVPVFWACGVTPQSIVMSSKPSFCITHAPGHMLVLDSMNEELST